MCGACGQYGYSAQFVLTCIRKLASLCLALDLSVTVRWIPTEINVSGRPSRIHDPSDIRDKSLTNLLTTVVKVRSHRDEMTAQRDFRETASMIQNQDGTVVARKRSGRNQRDQFTDIASSKATDEKSEDTCRRRECRRLEREGQRCDAFNGCRCT